MNIIKRTMLFLVALPLLFACSEKSNDETTDNEPEPHERAVEGTGHVAQLIRDPRLIGPEKPVEQVMIEEAGVKLNTEERNALMGYWVGDFGPNKINLALFEVKEDSVFGYSICAGNFRPIKGKMTPETEESVRVVMEEPGDDPYDGTFEFVIEFASEELSGSWDPFEAQGNTAKEYNLTRTEYEYDPSVGKYPQASQRYLEEDDIVDMMAEDLEIMRNEIYARHGYSFKNKKMRAEFNKKDWYIPMGIDIRDRLTDIEAQNIDLIYRFEEYYEEYYDDFGR